jgi:hypothetical protein
VQASCCLGFLCSQLVANSPIDFSSTKCSIEAFTIYSLCVTLETLLLYAECPKIASSRRKLEKGCHIDPGVLASTTGEGPPIFKV